MPTPTQTTKIIGLTISVCALILPGILIANAAVTKANAHAESEGHDGAMDLIHETREEQKTIGERLNGVREDIQELRIEQRAMASRILEAINRPR